MCAFMMELSESHAFEAEFAAAKFTEWSPRDAGSWNMYGHLLERNGNAHDAATAFKQAVQLDRAHLGYLQNLARSLTISSPARAVQLLRKISEEHEFDFYAQITYCMALFRSADGPSDGLAAALKDCEARLAACKNADLGEERALLAKLYYQCADVKSAIRVVESGAPSQLCALGMLSGDEKILDRAFKQLQNDAPSDALYLTSVYQLLSGSLLQAQRSLSRALFMFPSKQTNWIRLSRHLTRSTTNACQVPVAQSVAHWEQQGNIATADGQSIITTAHLLLGESKKAASIAQHKVLARPSSASRWRQLQIASIACCIHDSQTSASLPRLQRIHKNMQIVSQHEKNELEGTVTCGLLSSMLEYMQGDLGAAMQAIEHVITQITDSRGAEHVPSLVYRQIARVLLRNGEVSTAVGMLERAILASTDVSSNDIQQAVQASIRLELAYVCMKAHDVEAASILQAALKELPPESRLHFLVLYAKLSTMQDLKATAEHARRIQAEPSGQDTDMSELKTACQAIALAREAPAKASKLMTRVVRSDLVQAYQRTCSSNVCNA